MSSTSGAPRAATPRAGELEAAREAIARIDFFRSERPSDLRIARLGGLTNQVYRVDCEGASYAVRLPGEGTEDYIDRDFEAVAAREAARVGVAPEVVAADPGAGVLVTAFLPLRTMSPAQFNAAPGAPKRAGQLLRRLHDSGATFKFTFDLYGMIDDYLKALQGGAQKPPGFEAVRARAEDVRRALAAKPAALAPCHCDPLAENFLDDGRRMWLVDWEFSGMNDPLWDVADVTIEAGLGPVQARELTEAYFGRAPAAAEQGRIEAYKAMSDYLWTLWALLQHANKNPADDYWSYANSRFARCKSAMERPDFALHLAAIVRG